MPVFYFSEDISMPKIQKRKFTTWIKKVAEGFNKKIGEINYIFCSDKRILEINNTYLQHDYYTDIITFDYTEKNSISGDLFISLETVYSNAEKFNVSYDHELKRVIIHGILHLCGIGDKSPTERETMALAENRALSLLENL